MSVLCFIGTLKAGEHNFPFKFLIAGKSPVVGVRNGCVVCQMSIFELSLIDLNKL